MRVLVSLSVSLVVFLIGVVYTLSQPKLYESRGLLELTQTTQGSKSDGKRFSQRVPILAPQVALDVLKSASMVLQINKRLSTEELERLYAPYVDLKEEREIMRVLYSSEVRDFNLVPDTNIIEVIYRHQDSEIASILVNAHMKELIDYNLKRNIDFSMINVENMRLRADHEKEAIAKLANELAALEASAAKASEDELTRIAGIREELNEKRKSYEFLVGEMTTERVVALGGPGPIQIVDEATIPEKHISPNIPLWVFASFLAGLFGGVISFCLIGRIRKFAA